MPVNDELFLNAYKRHYLHSLGSITPLSLQILIKQSCCQPCPYAILLYVNRGPISTSAQGWVHTKTKQLSVVCIYCAVLEIVKYMKSTIKMSCCFCRSSPLDRSSSVCISCASQRHLCRIHKESNLLLSKMLNIYRKDYAINRYKH